MRDTAPQSLGSDNHSGVHPDIMQALIAANVGHAPAYGTDPWTAQAEALLAEHFGSVGSFFVFNGTAANVLALRTMTPSHGAVLCADTAHVHVDECAAPECHIGCKVLPLPSYHGKVRAADVRARLIRGGDQHFAAPKVLSLAQPTELGTLYTVEELSELAQICRELGLLLHMDGARLTQAAAALRTSLRALSGDVGVDVLSFGGTKNGLMFGDAIVFFNPTLLRDFNYMRKQAMQLASKTRFIAAQFIAWLKGDLWRRNACHANAMAQHLAHHLREVPGVSLTHPVEANAVFATLPRAWIKSLRRNSFFYVWDERRSEVRLMTSFDTDLAKLAAFVAQAHALAQGH